MPTRAVTIRRREVVGAFLLLVLVAVGGAWYNDYRIDQAEMRINANRASVVDLRESNERQARLRVDLLQERRRADLLICREVESIKERLRASVTVNLEEFNRTLEQLNIDPKGAQGLALLASSRERERELLERFAPNNCRRLTRR